MNQFLNTGLAWISVWIAGLLCSIYVLRKLVVATKGKAKFLVWTNRFLRKYHIFLGILLVITGFIHGYFSSQSVFSFNLGTISWIISILLGINFMARKPLSKFKNWLYFHRILTIIFVIFIIWHIYDVAGSRADRGAPNQTNTSEQKITATDVTKTVQGATLKDGTYTGSGECYRGTVKVSVEVKNNTIQSIAVIQVNDDYKFYQRAFDTVVNAILKNQTTAVDSESGATFSSVGIKNAVNNALSQAVVSGTLPSQEKLPENRGHGGGKP